MEDQGVVRCRICGERVGVYEPVFVRGSSERTSLLRDPDLVRSKEVVHVACVTSREGDPPRRVLPP